MSMLKDSGGEEKRIEERDWKKVEDNVEGELIRLLHENRICDEVKLLYKDNKPERVIMKEKVLTSEGINVEKLCRQYSNQDILIKIRNGKKIIIERTRIFKL